MSAAPETLDTDRLRLRRPQMSDAGAVFDYARDPEVTRYMDFLRHTAIGTARDFMQRCTASWESGEEYSWLLTVKPDDLAIGTIACRVRGRDVDFGYVLHRNYWGQGFATEAARAVVEWIWSLESIDRIWATCDVENLASARVLEKAGLSKEAVLPRSMVRPNLGAEPRDTLLYSRMRDRSVSSGLMEI